MTDQNPNRSPSSQQLYPYQRAAILLEKGIATASSGRREDAYSFCWAATQLDPANARAWAWRAELCNDPQEALVFTARALTLDAHDEVARSTLRRIRRCLPNSSPLSALSVDEGWSPPRVSVPSSQPTQQAPPVPFRARLAAALDTALYLGQRLGFALLILLAIVYLCFFGLDMARGTPFGPALGRGVMRTVDYLGQLLRADLGTTFSLSRGTRQEAVSAVLGPMLVKSLGLLAVSLGLAAVLGVGLGTLAARWRHSPLALATNLFATLGVALPSFFTALLLQLGAVWYTRQVGRSLLPMGGFGWDSHLVLPSLVLAARPIAQLTRMTYNVVSEAWSQDYVRTVRGKGASDNRVLFRHIFRNVAIPILTTLGTSVRFSLSSLPVVELFFSWPGVGFNLLRAISQKDDYLTVALSLCMGLLFILVNWLLDWVYRLVDPRLREEQPSIREQGAGLLSSAVGMVRDMFAWLTDNRLVRWLSRRRPEPDPFRQAMSRRAAENSHFEVTAADYSRERRRTWMRATMENPALLFGLVVVLGLLIVVGWGPALSPNNPYVTVGLTQVDGEWVAPPFAPSAEYPLGTDVLGRDILSLILYGARRTLSMAFLVVLARMVIGTVLGALAGRFSGSWLDRLVMSLAEVIAAFPSLLFAMILILALGIRQGLNVFIVALCFVGWGEVMQFIRGEVKTISAQPYIESAVAVGLREGQIIFSHVLPNLISSLIVLGALEMGAVMMLVGELGFVGIFIGGGSFAELQAFAPPYHYSDVPEWSALLSNVRLYARSYPWTALYPSLAFFVSILGLNLFGEGLRRMVERLGVGFTRLLNRYTVAAAALLILALSWVQTGTGPLMAYRKGAGHFDGGRALMDVYTLASEQMNGRRIGHEGVDAAAQYIAAQFEAAGLQPAGEDFGYFQTVKRDWLEPTEVPYLAVVGEDDKDQPLVFRKDFNLYPSLDNPAGERTAEVVALGLGDFPAGNSYGRWSVQGLGAIEVPGAAVMVTSPRAEWLVQLIDKQAVLVVTDDPADLERGATLSTHLSQGYSSNRLREADAVPVFYITEEVANRLLASKGITVDDLRAEEEKLGAQEWFGVRTGVRVHARLVGEEHNKTDVRHVIGHLPGAAGLREGASTRERELQLDQKAILVVAQYDGFGREVDGTLYPGANDNASGVALMLELIRAWNEMGYQPKKTFIFVAYAGEGYVSGQVPSRQVDPTTFLKAKYGFATSLEIEAVVYLRGVGGGTGDGLALATEGSLRLGELFESAAQEQGLAVSRRDEGIDLGVVFERVAVGMGGGEEAPYILVSWEGYEDSSRLATDTVALVDPQKLDQVGRSLSLALMVIGRETVY
ncbi:MAG: ABC transporter permease subunit [Chloroflexota bacterium]|nr:ABC transporter permease subunit [Chloroflexota bacterium]